MNTREPAQPMSPSFLLKKLNLNLNLDRFPTVDNDLIMDIILTETLPTFSNYFPLKVDRLLVDFSEKNRAPESPNTFYLYDKDENFLGKDVLILGIQEINTSWGNNNSRGANLHGITSCNFGDAMVNLFNGIAMTGVTSLLNVNSIAGTYEFVPPNKVKFYTPITAAGLYLTLKCTHPSNLTTIPHTKGDFFYRLAELDVKRVLFERLRMYKTIETTYGNIDLQIDEWQDTDLSKRQELINQMEEKYLLDDQVKIIAM